MNPFPSYCTSSSFANRPSFGDQAGARSYTDPLLGNFLTMDVDGNESSSMYQRSSEASDSDDQWMAVSDDKTPPSESASDFDSTRTLVTYTDTPVDFDLTMRDVSDLCRDFFSETLSRLSDLDAFADADLETPTSTSSSSSQLLLTPVSPFRRDVAAAIGELEEATEVDAFSEFLQGAQPGCGALDLTMVDTQMTPMSPLVDSTSGEPSCSPMFWDLALPSDLPHFHTLDDVDVYLPTYASTADIPLNFCPSSPSHSPITHVSSANTFVLPPASSSSTSSQPMPPTHSPESHHACRLPRSLPLFQPQPVRPIPLIPLDDLAFTASSSVPPRTIVPTGTCSNDHRNGESIAQHPIVHSKPLGNPSLSPTSLLCQPVSCAVRYQSQKNCSAAKGRNEPQAGQCDECSCTA